MYVLVGVAYEDTWPVAVSESVDALKQKGAECAHPIGGKVREVFMAKWRRGDTPHDGLWYAPMGQGHGTYEIHEIEVI